MGSDDVSFQRVTTFGATNLDKGILNEYIDFTKDKTKKILEKAAVHFPSVDGKIKQLLENTANPDPDVFESLSLKLKGIAVSEFFKAAGISDSVRLTFNFRSANPFSYLVTPTQIHGLGREPRLRDFIPVDIKDLFDWTAQFNVRSGELMGRDFEYIELGEYRALGLGSVAQSAIGNRNAIQRRQILKEGVNPNSERPISGLWAFTASPSHSTFAVMSNDSDAFVTDVEAMTHDHSLFELKKWCSDEDLSVGTYPIDLKIEKFDPLEIG